MSPDRFHRSHPLAGIRLIVLYVTFVIGLALLATILQQTS